MAIKSLAPYEFPSRSAVENYGGMMMVHIVRRDNVFYCCPATVLVSPDMTWQEFVDGQVLPYCGADPDFNADGTFEWKLVEQDFQPDPSKTLAELGIKHKNAVSIDVT